MKIDHDGLGGLILETEEARFNLDDENCIKAFGIWIDGICRVCHMEINEGEQLCCDCLNTEIARHRQYCDGYTHQGIR